jgi:phage/plasmid-like protein (TIGR03299 family)
MSKETATWLNQNTLIGFTDKRGHAWHYRLDEQGAEPNHYPGAVPVADVKRRLFGWQAVAGSLAATVLSEDGVLVVQDPERQAIVRPDTGTIMGVFKSGYTIHQYDEWLLESVATLLDADLSIGSAGLLKGGGVAWVSVEVPDTITTPEGVTFRPNLLAATSHDGSLSTTFQRCVTNTVCDNTMSAALGERGQSLKVKHSRYSRLKLQGARDALAIVHDVGEAFAAQVSELCAVTVTDREWTRFLDGLLGVPAADASQRSRTMAANKREAYGRLWNHDERVAPWRGTAYGVLQAVNTHEHHEGIVRGMDRAERNMLRAATGGVDTLDRETVARIMAVVS